MSRIPLLSCAAMAALALAGCGGGPALPVASGYGPNPALPQPHRSLLPTVRIAKVAGWAPGAKPVAAEGLAVGRFADGLDHPRWLYVLPNGDVLAAESNAPAKPPEGVKGWIMGKMMAMAGAGVPSPDRIMLLRDANGDGVAETKTVFIDKVHSPFGMALVGDKFYVAATDAVMRYPYAAGQTQITAPGVVVTDLPAGQINHHWTKNLAATPDGASLLVTVGSNSNVGENGLDAEEGRAAVWKVDLKTGTKALFATGLRNPNGLDFDPATGLPWVVVNERDELGNDLVPDYLTQVKPGAFYGWPYSYYGQTLDARIKELKPDLVAKAIKPDYALGSHTAPLGLTFYRASLLGPRYAGGAFIGQHGSWNRSPPAGYQVIFVPFAGGKPQGEPLPVLTGFLDAQGHAQGRPVGVAVDKAGALLVADDVGGVVWRVTPAAGAISTAAGPVSAAGL